MNLGISLLVGVLVLQSIIALSMFLLGGSKEKYSFCKGLEKLDEIGENKSKK